MDLYRITIKPVASYTSLLQSDTFFGAFCWSYKYLYGEAELKEFLSKNCERGPQIIFSNAFPYAELPLPMGSYDPERTNSTAPDKTALKIAYQENKTLKKCTLIPRDIFLNIQQGSLGGYSKHLQKDELLQEEVTHNMVNRDTGTVQRSNDGSGNLFVTDVFFADPEALFDIYILTSMDPGIIQEVLMLMFELGIGANKSTGKGQFVIIPSEDGSLLTKDEQLTNVDNANGYMALSNFIPAAADPVHGWYKPLIKYGKLDREYSAGQYPYKKPLLFMQAGAVFKTNPVKEYYGSILKDMAVESGVIVNACTIALPINIPD